MQTHREPTARSTESQEAPRAEAHSTARCSFPVRPHHIPVSPKLGASTTPMGLSPPLQLRGGALAMARVRGELKPAESSVYVSV